MIEVQRIRLLQIPSRRASGWREAAAAACLAKGWAFHVQDREDPTPLLDPNKSSLIFGWVDHAPEGHVTDWLVQTGRPEEAAELLAQTMALSVTEALYETSLRLASATTLVRAGAVVSNADDLELNVPGLGKITLDLGVSSEARTLPCPLDMFRSLPPLPGAEASWPQQLFRYSDPKPAISLDGQIELIGRRRLLFNGPHIFLPRGLWQFHATFSVRPEDKADLLIEWGYGDRAVQLHQAFDEAGRYEIEMQQTWDEVAPADFRISLLTPVLDGGFEFHGGVVKCLAGPDGSATAL